MKQKEIKTTIVHGRDWSLLACMVGLICMLSACSSSDVDAVLVDELASVSGQVKSTANPAGEEGVSVTGIYSDGNLLNPSTRTRAGGAFSLPVLKNTAHSVQVSKTGSDLVTLNSAKQTLNADISGFDVEVPTTMEVDDAILNAFSAAIALPGQAWLAVNVVDGVTDEDVADVVISITGAPGFYIYTNCAGTGISAPATVVNESPCNRGGPMYLAYFDTDNAEVTVSDGLTQQLAPVRRGELTFLEFER